VHEIKKWYENIRSPQTYGIVSVVLDVLGSAQREAHCGGV